MLSYKASSSWQLEDQDVRARSRPGIRAGVRYKEGHLEESGLSVYHSAMRVPKGRPRNRSTVSHSKE